MKTILFVFCCLLATASPVALSAQEEITNGRLTCIVDVFGNMAMTIEDRSPEEVIKYKVIPSDDDWEQKKFQNLDKDSSNILEKLKKGVRYSVCVNIFDQTGNLTNSWVFSITP